MPSLRGLQAQVAVNHFTITARENGNFEAKLPDATTHSIYRSVVPSGVACIKDEPVNVPSLDKGGWCCSLRKHSHLHVG
jgi:hypothetical protein